MTMTEGTLRSDAVSARDGRLHLAVRLPWYRSLALSCLETIEVAVDGAQVPLRSISTGGFTGPVADAGGSAAWWDLRDALDVALDAPGVPGATHQVGLALAVRIPYIQQAPGVPLVQRATAQIEGTVR
ncbi:C-glycoside deglycosidase beta subunit domain-containing protein [Blastococcus sp. SYSU DS1021]